MKVMRQIGVAIAGILSGALVVAGIEWISHVIYPMPNDVSSTDRTQLSEWIKTLPIGAFLIVLAAWCMGCLVAGYVARRISINRKAFPGIVAVGLLTIATIMNLVTIPHPVWLWFAGIGGCLVFGMIGMLLAAPGAYSISATRIVASPIENVFGTLAAVEEFATAVPHITKVEFLSDQKQGLGTRFRETRIMNGKEAMTELEITEFVDNHMIRYLSEAGGTTWDTVFRVAEADVRTEMTMKMDAIPKSLFAKILVPMILGMISKAVENDMDSIKEHCEKR